MSEFHEITDAELDALIGRVNEAVAHNLALAAEDMQLLLEALLMLAQLQTRMADQDITLHKLRKLAGIVSSSEKLQDVLPGTGKRAKKRRTPTTPPAEKEPPVIHQQCHHHIEGLAKGQRCPECERGTLYKYAPVRVLRISGQTPLTSTQHILERLRCNACGAYFTAEFSADVKRDGQANQQYDYSAGGKAMAVCRRQEAMA